MNAKAKSFSKKSIWLSETQSVIVMAFVWLSTVLILIENLFSFAIYLVFFLIAQEPPPPAEEEIEWSISTRVEAMNQATLEQHNVLPQVKYTSRERPATVHAKQADNLHGR